MPKNFLLLMGFLVASSSSVGMFRRETSAGDHLCIHSLGSHENPYLVLLRWNGVEAALGNFAIRGWFKTPEGTFFRLREDAKGRIIIFIEPK